jgi:hypothetical protein
MVTKPDFSKERKEYLEVEAVIRRRGLLSLLAMAVQSSLVANFNLPAYLKIFFIIMYIVQGLVLGICAFLSWYQKYKFKRLTQGRELWYFWARLGDGIQYYFVARTRMTRAKRRAYDKAYETSVQTASKIDRIDQGVSNVEDGILVQMVEKDRAIQNLNEDKSSLIKANADLQVSNAGLIAENDAVKLHLERAMAQYEEEKTALLSSIGKITATHERQQRYIQEKLDALEAQKDALLKDKETERAEYAAKLAETKGVADLEIASLREKLNQIMAEKDRKILELESEVTIVKADLEDITAKYKEEADAMVAKTAELNLKIQEATIRYESLKQENEDLQVQAEAVMASRGRKQTKGIESLFINATALKKMDSILSFLRRIQEQDKRLTDGYCKRLALYFCALRSLGYITDNISVYAKYFYPHSGKNNENSYIKTFNNMKALMQGSPLLSSAMSEMKNLVES